MELLDKVCVVTGAANGIGRAMARRFHAEGTHAVVIADLDVEGATAVADELNAIRPGSSAAYGLNVADDAQVGALVESVMAQFGPIDLFAANAGVGIGADPFSPDAEWDLAFGVNIKAHYYAARHLLPAWLARGEGYFLSTASAAGLLTQIGSAPYAVTKHAAVAFAEWMAITYGDQGVKVSCLCPMGVNTNMLNAGTQAGGVEATGSAVVRAAGAVLEPDDVAAEVLATIKAERFLVLPHPEVLDMWRRKTSDYDRWLGGMRRLQAKVAAG